MAARSSWEGFLKLSLLSVPVKVYSAAVGGRAHISFHQIHAGCGSRIRHQKVCPVHGEVSKDDVVSGYEYTKGKYVIVKPDELTKLRRENEKAITIDVFVDPTAIAPMYYSGRSFYLTPDGKIGQKPYAVIERVMREQNRNAIARVVLAGRQQIALLQPADGMILMAILNYDEQIKKPSAFKDEIPDVKLSQGEIDLATNLVEASTHEKFDLAEYHDDYESDLARLIEAKSKGKKIASQRPAKEPAVVNLMDALRNSLNQKQRSGKTTTATRSPKRKAG